MNQEVALFWIQESMRTAILVVAPMLVTGLVIGLIVSLFQAVTSIQEMTLSYVPKMLAVAVLLYFMTPWLLQTMVSFSTRAFEFIPLIAE
jgi:flagellar biosynthetic protein FliQ